MFGLIQIGYNLFGTGSTPELALEDAKEWTNDPIHFGENEGSFKIVKMYEVTDTDLSWDDILNWLDASEECFDVDSETGLIYSTNGFSDHATHWFTDDEGRDLFTLQHKLGQV